jgi:tryptophanase
MKTIIEPFRIKVVEPIRLTTLEERHLLRRAAEPVRIRDDVMIDLLTDSGTSAMSATNGRAHARRRIYAGSPSFYRFESARIMPAHHPHSPGRAAEAILFSILGGPGVASNTHFDTTQAHRGHQREAVDWWWLRLGTRQPASFKEHGPEPAQRPFRAAGGGVRRRADRHQQTRAAASW